jgi:superfamily II DNA or RNA helicase
MNHFHYSIRPYQQDSRTQLNNLYAQGNKRLILCLPTGAGKTVTFAWMLHLATQKGLSAWVVVDRIELAQQAQDTLDKFGLNGIVQVHMVETLCKRNYPPPDIIIIDECHVGNFRKLIDKYPDTRMLGVTATPISSNKKEPLNQIFEDIICPVQVSDLIADGFLCPAMYSNPKINDDAFADLKMGVNDYTEKSMNEAFSHRALVDGLDFSFTKCGHEKSIVFAPSVEKVIEIANRYGAIPLHSKMKDSERRFQVERFRANPNAWLINCGIATRGFDEPAIRNVIVFRKTTSLALWLQMCGRGSRPMPKIGKDHFVIHDFGGNRLEHGLWEMDRDWVSIFKNAKPPSRKEKALGMAPEKQCISCQSFIPMQARVCSFCGANQPQAEVLQATGITEPIMYGKIPERLQKPYADMTVAELIERAKYGSANVGRPFKKGWVLAQIKQHKGEQGLREYAKIMGYKSGWVDRQLATSG